jgi:hypothetical protein
MSDTVEPRAQAMCLVCGADLRGRRCDALTCGGACRAERSRLRRLLAGESVDGWDSMDDRLQSRHRRTELGIQANAGTLRPGIGS